MMAQTNHAVSGCDTLFIPCAARRTPSWPPSSSAIARFGGDVTSMVPEPVASASAERYAR